MTRPAQLDLFEPAPRSGPGRDGRRLMAALKRVERGEAAWPERVAGLSRRQIRVLMRPLPRITVPK